MHGKQENSIIRLFVTGLLAIIAIAVMAKSTISAKSLGTFPVICAIDEVHNPLPLITMLFKRHMTSILGISDTFPNS